MSGRFQKCLVCLANARTLIPLTWPMEKITENTFCHHGLAEHFHDVEEAVWTGNLSTPFKDYFSRND